MLRSSLAMVDAPQPVSQNTVGRKEVQYLSRGPRFVLYLLPAVLLVLPNPDVVLDILLGARPENLEALLRNDARLSASASCVKSFRFVVDAFGYRR